MKDAYYFRHDSNASNDPNIVLMRARYGWKGYGLFWAIVERLRDMDGYRLRMDRIPALAYDLREEELEKFVYACIRDFELFRTDDTHFWSDSLIRRMSSLDELRQKRSASGKLGAAVRWRNDGDAIATPQGNNGDALALPPEGDGNANATAMANRWQADGTYLGDSGDIQKEEETDVPASLVDISDEERSALAREYGERVAEEYVGRMRKHKAKTGKTYRSDIEVIRGWLFKDAVPANPTPPPFKDPLADMRAAKARGELPGQLEEDTVPETEPDQGRTF